MVFFPNGTNPPTVGAEEEVDIIVIQVLVRCIYIKLFVVGTYVGSLSWFEMS